MALDTFKMVDKLNRAAKALDEAIEEFSAVDRMTTIDSYIMGHIRAAQAVTNSAAAFVAQCQASKIVEAPDKRKPKALPEPSKT